MTTPDNHDDDMSLRHRDAEAHERQQMRELAETMAASALALVERFGWSRANLIETLDYELRERMQDAAEGDAAFRNWYAAWRNENPDAA